MTFDRWSRTTALNYAKLSFSRESVKYVNGQFITDLSKFEKILVKCGHLAFYQLECKRVYEIIPLYFRFIPKPRKSEFVLPQVFCILPMRLAILWMINEMC